MRRKKRTTRGAIDAVFLCQRLICGLLIAGGGAWLLFSEKKLVALLAFLCGCAGLFYTELRAERKQVAGAQWVALLPFAGAIAAAWCLWSYTEMPVLARAFPHTAELRLRAVRWEHLGAEMELGGQVGSEKTIILSGLPQTEESIRAAGQEVFPGGNSSSTSFNGTKWGPLDDGALAISGTWSPGARLKASAYGTEEPVFAGGLCASYALADFREGREYLVSTPPESEAEPGSGPEIRTARLRLIRHWGAKLQLVLLDGQREVPSVRKEVRRFQSIGDFLKGRGNEKIRGRLAELLGATSQRLYEQVFLARESPILRGGMPNWFNSGSPADLVIPSWTPSVGSGEGPPLGSLVRAVRSGGGTGAGTSEGGAAATEFTLEEKGFKVETLSDRSARVRLLPSGSVELRYNLPERLRLPKMGDPGIKDTVLLSTADSTVIRRMGMADEDGKLEPQYIFDIGRPDAGSSRTIRLADDRSSFGPPNQPEGETRGQTRVNQEVSLGDGSARAIISLVDPVRKLSPQANVGALPLIFAGAALSAALWLVWNQRPSQQAAIARMNTRQEVGKPVPSENDYRPTSLIVFGLTVWMAAVGLLTTRAVLSLRASLQPPETAVPGDLAAFAEAWNQAVFSLGIVPVILGALLLLLVPKFNEVLRRDRPRLEASVVAGALCGALAAGFLRWAGNSLGVCVQAGALAGMVVSGLIFWSLPIISGLLPGKEVAVDRIRPVFHGLAAVVLVVPGLIGLLEIGGWQLPLLSGTKLVLLGIGISVLGAVLVGASPKGETRRDARSVWLWLLAGAAILAARALEILVLPAILVFLGVAWMQMSAKGGAASGEEEGTPVTKRLRLSYPPLLVGAWALLLSDPGTIIYMGPLALCVASLFALRPGGQWQKAWAGLLIGAFAFLAVPLFLSQASSWAAHQFSSPIGRKTFVPRAMLATPQGEARLWTEPQTSYTSTGATGEVGSGAINSMQQRWQMLSYVQAPSDRVKFLEAPFDGSGISEKGTLLSDAALTAFLISEHGRLAGFFLVVLVVAAGSAFLASARRLIEEPGQETRALGLVLVGGVLAFAGGYVALSNVWAVPFVGQNFPLLGLSSDSDLILYTLLIALGLLLMSEGLEAAEGGGAAAEEPVQAAPQPKQRALAGSAAGSRAGGRSTIDLVKLAQWSPIAAAGVWCLWFGGTLALQPRQTPGFELPKAVVNSMESKVLAARESTQANALESEFAKDASLMERMFFERFKAERQDTILVRGARGIVVNAGRFVLDPLYSDPTRQLAWQGRLLLTNSAPAEGDTLQQSVPFSASLPLTSTSRRTVVSQSQSDWSRGSSGARRLSFRVENPTGRGGQWDFGSIEAGASGPNLEWDTSRMEGLSIEVNDIRQGTSGDDVPLKRGDQVAAVYTGTAGRRVLLRVGLAGAMEQSASGVALQNGKRVRVYPLGSDFSFAAGISEAYESIIRSKGSTEKGDRTISIDEGLHVALQNRLKSWGRTRGRPISRLIAGGGERQFPFFTAVTVIDSFTGKLLALPSIPHTDPNNSLGKAKLELANSQGASVERERDVIQAWQGNWNLRSATTGSTIKPLTYAALAEGLNGPSFDMSRLSVNERAGDPGPSGFTRIGNVSIFNGRRGLMGDESFDVRSFVDMREYLRDSRTYPAAVTAFLGLGERKEDVSEYILQSGADVRYSGSDRRIEFDFRSGASGNDLTAGYLDDTIIMKTMREVYGPFIWNYTAQRKRPDLLASDEEKTFLENYLPDAPLDVEGLSRLRVEIFPDYHLQNTPLLTEKLNLARYFIGGGDMQWSTMLNAMSFARITVGRKVTPTFRADSPTITVPSGQIIGGIAWREQNLLGPLGRISTLGGRSLSEFNDYQEDANGRQVRPGFRVVAKTGTIGQGDGSGYESELVSFTAGYFNRDWEPGRTISGSLNIRAARVSGGPSLRFGLLQQLMAELKPYVLRRRAGGVRTP